MTTCLMVCWAILTQTGFSAEVEVSEEGAGAEVHKIEIPGINYPFNASIIEYGKNYLLAFRYDTDKFTVAQSAHLGLVVLNPEFKVISPISYFNARETRLKVHSQTEDPRLFRVKDQIYLLYSDAEDGYFMSDRKYFIAEVKPCQGYGLTFDFKNIKKLVYRHSNFIEKNWFPIVDQAGQIFVVYNVHPFKILKLDLTLESGQENVFDMNEDEHFTFHWPYGRISGGTPAFADPFDENRFIAIFHSRYTDSIPYKYHMGVVKFDKEYPFKPTEMSADPLFHEDFYTNAHPLIPYCLIIFPAGIVIKKDYFVISYGKNDSETYVLKIPREDLTRNLVRVGAT